MQEAEVYLPIVSQKYTIDLSRTRSHFLPGYPLDVVVSVNTEVHTSGAGWALKCVALASGHFALPRWCRSSQSSCKHQSVNFRGILARFYRPAGGSVDCV